ncbi:MAG: hypothetical protein Q7R34_16505 [Dehalococcoidia bacterium]|nr:hypothetical protein [Dehalococcoidia bacterium]
MNKYALLLREKDTTVTSDIVSPFLWPRYQLQRLADDISTTAGIISGQNFAIVEPTSPWITVFVQKTPAQSLDVWVEADVYFPPKKTRPLVGKLVKRGRAKFQTAFGDDLVEM